MVRHAFLQLLGEDKFECYEINNLSNDFIKENFGAENNATIIGRAKKEHEINVAYKPDGSEIELTTEHAWAISRNDDKYVYIIDPNVGTEEWHIAIEDFKKAFDSCAVATLD